MNLTHLDKIIGQEQPRLFKLGAKIQKQHERLIRNVHRQSTMDEVTAQKIEQLGLILQALGICTQTMANYLTQGEEHELPDNS